MTTPPSQDQFEFPFVDNYNVPGSSFERIGFNKLSTPDEVRILYAKEDKDDCKPFLRPSVRIYHDLNLAVKFGHHVSVSEAHCMLFVRKHCPEVPVPEVYAWRRDRRQTFIYMELVEGLSTSIGMVKELAKPMISALQNIPQSLVSPIPFVGHVNGGPLRNWRFINSSTPVSGPFTSVAEYHDWLAKEHGKSLTIANVPDETEKKRIAKYRGLLDDDMPIVLTHGDLNEDNILVEFLPDQHNTLPTLQIVAILDWSMAGWLPKHWESRTTNVGPLVGEFKEELKAENDYREAVNYFLCQGEQ